MPDRKAYENAIRIGFRLAARRYKEKDKKAWARKLSLATLKDKIHIRFVTETETLVVLGQRLITTPLPEEQEKPHLLMLSDIGGLTSEEIIQLRGPDDDVSTVAAVSIQDAIHGWDLWHHVIGPRMKTAAKHHEFLRCAASTYVLQWERALHGWLGEVWRRDMDTFAALMDVLIKDMDQAADYGAEDLDDIKKDLLADDELSEVLSEVDRSSPLILDVEGERLRISSREAICVLCHYLSHLIKAKRQLYTEAVHAIKARWGDEVPDSLRIARYKMGGFPRNNTNLCDKDGIVSYLEERVFQQLPDDLQLDSSSIQWCDPPCNFAVDAQTFAASLKIAIENGSSELRFEGTSHPLVLGEGGGGPQQVIPDASIPPSATFFIPLGPEDDRVDLINSLMESPAIKTRIYSRLEGAAFLTSFIADSDEVARDVLELRVLLPVQLSEAVVQLIKGQLAKCESHYFLLALHRNGITHVTVVKEEALLSGELTARHEGQAMVLQGCGIDKTFESWSSSPLSLHEGGLDEVLAAKVLASKAEEDALRALIRTRAWHRLSRAKARVLYLERATVELPKPRSKAIRFGFGGGVFLPYEMFAASVIFFQRYLQLPEHLKKLCELKGIDKMEDQAPQATRQSERVKERGRRRPGAAKVKEAAGAKKRKY